MNKAFLIGRLTKDPNVNYLSSGVAVASFTLAVDRTFKNRDGEKDTDFIPIVTWRKTAELCEKYLSKGSMAAVIGRIQTRSYEAQDGSTRYVTEIVADEVQFLSFGSSSKYYGEQNNTAFAPSESFSSPVDGFTEINDEDLPF